MRSSNSHLFVIKWVLVDEIFGLCLLFGRLEGVVVLLVSHDTKRGRFVCVSGFCDKNRFAQ